MVTFLLFLPEPMVGTLSYTRRAGVRTNCAVSSTDAETK